MAFVIMVAGPNGSGKTSLTSHTGSKRKYLGEYINPDEIAKVLVGTYDERVKQAQAIADDLRLQCFRDGRDFTFETVMSHPSKVDFFEQCRSAGFQTQLWFVATSDPRLNIQRVRQRVSQGGHDVPEDRIVARYHRSLALLPRAFRVAQRAVVFANDDRRGARPILIKRALTPGHATYRLMDDAPAWVVDSFRSALAPEVARDNT